MFTTNQLVAHLIGDYILQSDWMAKNKFTSKFAAMVHGLVYTLPFLFITLNPIALAFIAITHMIVDHYKVAKYVVWLKNFIGPSGYPKENMKHNGFNKDASGPPDHIGDWIYIITDNTIHLLCNGFAIGVLALLI